VKERQEMNNKNFIEAAVCAAIVDHFMECGVPADFITVITPFVEQEKLL
jgi:superfamily I DNA and/or RNA helicase